MSPLLQQRCRSMIGQAAMTAAEAAAQLQEVPQWAVVDGALERSFSFADFQQRFFAWARALLVSFG